MDEVPNKGGKFWMSMLWSLPYLQLLWYWNHLKRKKSIKYLFPVVFFLYLNLMVLFADHANHNLDQSNETNNLKGKESQQRILLHELEPFSLRALHELVSLVHDHINVAVQTQPMQSTLVSDPAPYVKDEHQKTLMTELFQLEDDPVAKILWNLEPHTLQNVFLAMAVSFSSPISYKP